jgi:hypothetical protein
MWFKAGNGEKLLVAEHLVVTVVVEAEFVVITVIMVVGTDTVVLVERVVLVFPEVGVVYVLLVFLVVVMV